MTRKSSKYRPRNVDNNPMLLAMTQTRALSAADVAIQDTIVRNALDCFRKGDDCAFYWRSLADTANMAHTLARMRLGGGPDAERIIGEAMQALAAVRMRSETRGTWTLYAEELVALEWLVTLYCTIQVPAATYGEFNKALHDTNRRLNQARAGNAPAGAITIFGDMAGQKFEPINA